MKASSAFLIAAAASTASARAARGPPSAPNTESAPFKCPLPNGSFCASGKSLRSPTMIKCTDGVPSAPIDCVQRLAHNGPKDIYFAPCWQSGADVGDATCTKNCTAYPNNEEPYPVPGDCQPTSLETATKMMAGMKRFFAASTASLQVPSYSMSVLAPATPVSTFSYSASTPLAAAHTGPQRAPIKPSFHKPQVGSMPHGPPPSFGAHGGKPPGYPSDMPFPPPQFSHPPFSFPGAPSGPPGSSSAPSIDADPAPAPPTSAYSSSQAPPQGPPQGQQTSEVEESQPGSQQAPPQQSSQYPSQYSSQYASQSQQQPPPSPPTSYPSAPPSIPAVQMSTSEEEAPISSSYYSQSYPASAPAPSTFPSQQAAPTTYPEPSSAALPTSSSKSYSEAQATVPVGSSESTWTHAWTHTSSSSPSSLASSMASSMASAVTVTSYTGTTTRTHFVFATPSCPPVSRHSSSAPSSSPAHASPTPSISCAGYHSAPSSSAVPCTHTDHYHVPLPSSSAAAAAPSGAIPPGPWNFNGTAPCNHTAVSASASSTQWAAPTTGSGSVPALPAPTSLENDADGLYGLDSATGGATLKAVSGVAMYTIGFAVIMLAVAFV